jgi:hypothetical protein
MGLSKLALARQFGLPLGCVVLSQEERAEAWRAKEFDTADHHFLGQIRAHAWEALVQTDSPYHQVTEASYAALKADHPHISHHDFVDGVHRKLWTAMQTSPKHRLPTLTETLHFLETVADVEIRYED